MRTYFIFALLVGAAAVLGWQGVKLFGQQRALQKELADTSAQVESLLKENSALKQRIEYLSYPENLEKELRALNYKSSGEKLLILVNESRQ